MRLAVPLRLPSFSLRGSSAMSSGTRLPWLGRARVRWPGWSKLHRYTGTVNLLLGLLLCYTLAELTWRFIPPPIESAVRPPALNVATDGSPAAGSGAALSPRQMADWHLFGMAQTPAATAAPVATVTALPLNLRGVIASANAAIARAIIAEPSGGENYYAVGSAVPGGATLKAIYADHVILDRGGISETLALPQEILGSDGNNEGSHDEMIPDDMPPEAMVAPSDDMQNLREMAQQNPQTLLERIRPIPVNEGGKLVGYRLQPRDDPELLARAGLEPNDIVTALNGVRLDNPAQATEMLRGISTQTQFRIDVLRDNSHLSLVLNIE